MIGQTMSHYHINLGELRRIASKLRRTHEFSELQSAAKQCHDVLVQRD